MPFAPLRVFQAVRSFPLLMGVALMLAGPLAGAQHISVSSFSTSSYNSDTAAMDSTLGITGYTIEDFEDTTLVSGLSVKLDFRSPSPNSETTWTTLPGTPTSLGVDPWDGSHSLASTLDNGDTLNNRAQAVTFLFDSGASSVGIGLSGFQSLNQLDYPVTDHRLYINGVAMSETLESIVGSQLDAQPIGAGRLSAV